MSAGEPAVLIICDGTACAAHVLSFISFINPTSTARSLRLNGLAEIAAGGLFHAILSVRLIISLIVGITVVSLGFPYYQVDCPKAWPAQ